MAERIIGRTARNVENLVSEVLKVISDDPTKLLLFAAILVVGKMWREERMETRRLNRVIEDGLFRLYRELRAEVHDRLAADDDD